MSDALYWRMEAERHQPRPRVACGYPSENAYMTGIYCELPEGHAGDHEAVTAITWNDGA